ncbi:MAG: 1-acyl-sn-glycerol-3-phosphate acyltransferase [Rhodothermales bacterium]|nr:1-acyl-sn-glycerol-3-phosphate acyltransferase [Rhodothermales bacterium]
MVHFKPESDRARYRAWRQERACRKFCRILGIELVSVGGARPSGSTVVVANHLGLADPWILAAVLPVAFAAKAEMAGWPVMGWICRTVGIIFVERDRRLAAARFVEELREAGKSGVSVLVFPEGTTGDGRTIRTFKTAGFAAVAGLEDGSVLPVYHNAVRINGAPTTIDDREIMGWTPEQPMMESVFGWLRQKSITVEVRIGEPIACAGMDRKELAALAEQAVRELAGDLVEG